MSDPTNIQVRSHVARDFLQSAALFKSDRLVVWEYVSNGLQYTDPGVQPVVRVTMNTSRKEIVVEDNGRGMDREGLQNFFIMHGENLERKTGRRGRGRFGTGKCAAFGIAKKLRVSTVRNGRRNTVELTRRDIEAAGQSGIPVREIESDVPTDEPNGTIVTIEEINLRKLDVRGVTSFLERHLAHWPNRPTVIVNSHVCEFDEPPVEEVRPIRPDGMFRDELGEVELTLKVARSPLDSELQGVSISTNGVWLETTLAGAEGQPMSNFIFGEIDVPSLDDDSAPIPAFDMSRSMQLNRSNETVQALLAFIGREVDKLRRELVRREKARREQEEIKKLAREADLIAQMINEDFQEFSDRVARVKAKAGRGRDAGARVMPAGTDEGVLTRGAAVPSEIVAPIGEIGKERGTAGNGHEPPRRNPVLRPKDDGAEKGDPVGGRGRRRRPQGGFTVQFRRMGEGSLRATYSPSDRAIFINLDHPQIAAARGPGGTDDPVFMRLAYEVAFSEYAIALASELAAQNEYIEPSDSIFDIRDTVNRMARRAAPLYRG